MVRVNVPDSIRAFADRGVAVIDVVCHEHPGMEYADLCRAVVCTDRRAARPASVPLQIRAFSPWADSLGPQDGS